MQNGISNMLKENREDCETGQDEMRISKPISALFFEEIFNRKWLARQRRSEMIFNFCTAKFSTILSFMLLLNLQKTGWLIAYKIILFRKH